MLRMENISLLLKIKRTETYTFLFFKTELCTDVYTSMYLFVVLWDCAFFFCAEAREFTLERYVVPAGRYVVPTGKDNVIVSAGRAKVIPAGRTILVLSQHQFQQYHATTVSNNNAKFPYLKKDEYETWAMKMEYWIMNSDHNLWNIVLNGNSRKKTGRDPKGNIMILPPVSVEEHIAVQRETKARTILLQSLPEDHMADFHHLDDARDIWLAVKARFGGNDESKKMRKSMLKQEFSEFRVSESEGLHKGYDRFQKILSQLNQMQAKPDNEDCNMKFLRALPPSWSQVAITLKTKGGLDYLSFDDLYNKLRTLEIDVKGGSSYDSRGTSAPTHSAFISAASTNSKMSYADSQNQSPSITFTTASSSADTSSNVIESVLHSFVAESDPQQQITYEDFDQIGKLDLEELDIKWQMAMLSVRINRFEKKAGRKMKFNNRDAARFDKKKVKCYKCSELGHFARECTGKQLDSKARYSAFKLKELDKSEEPKALLSVDSMLNWSDHEGEDEEKGAAQVYGMIAGDDDDAAGDASGDVSDAAAEFALMGLSSQVHTCPFGCEHKYAELKKDFDNLEVQYKDCYIQVQAYKNTLQTLEQQKAWYQSNQLALEERIRILTADLENTTNMLKYTEKLNDQVKLDGMIRFVKAVGMHVVPSPITRTFMPPSNKPDLDDTQVTYGSNDKSSNSETIGFASYVSSVKSSSSKTNEHLASASSSVDFKTVSKTADQKPCSTIDDPSFSFKENVTTPRNICDKNGINNRSHCKNNSFVFLVLRLALFMHYIPSFVPRAAYVPADSRNLPSSVSAGSAFPAGSRNRPASVSAGGMILLEVRWQNHGKRHYKGLQMQFENVYYVEELQNFKLFFEFQLPENSQVVLRVPRRHNLYSFNLTEIQPERDITYLLAKASSDESTKWHRRMAHVNFKNINKLAKHGLVNGLPSKLFTNDHNCVACNKGKQHKASYKAITAVSTISEPLQLLHMDLFGPTSIRSIDHKYYSLVVTDDLSSHLKPFGCHVTILNTSDHLGKFEGKADEGFIVGHGSKSTHKDPHIHAGTQDDSDSECDEQVIVVPSFPSNRFSGPKASNTRNEAKDTAEKYGFGFSKDSHIKGTFKTVIWFCGSIDPAASISTGSIDPAASISAGSADPHFLLVLFSSEPVHDDENINSSGHIGSVEHSTRFPSPSDLANSISSSSEMEDIYHHPSTGIFSSSSYDADFGGTVTNLAPIVAVDPVPTKRVNNPSSSAQILGDLTFTNFYFVCRLVFYPNLNRVDAQALNDSNWVEAIARRDAKQFINRGMEACPYVDGKIDIGTKWILKNKRDARGIVVRNKARLVAQGHRQEEGINYDEVFAPVARIEAIRLFLAFASYMGFMVYVMILFLGLQRRPGRDEFDGVDDMRIDKYVQDMLKKFDMESVRTATTPYEASNPKSKDEPENAVNVHLYRSMIGSLMYLTASRLDICLPVSACSRPRLHFDFQFDASEIFKYLKGQQQH
ncbi:putative ribonuclease H-like domain-containing protein [Tanacetum coccineum]